MSVWINTTDLAYLRPTGPEAYSVGSTTDQALSYYIDLLEKWQITFQSLHLIRSNNTGSISESDQKSQLIHASMQYIAQLAAYRDQIHDSVIQSRIRICESISMLAHAVFILPHQSISRQIVKWCSFHNAPHHDRISGSVWRSIHKCILGGYITEASRMVKDLSDIPNDIQSALLGLLESVPLLDPANTCLTCSQFDHVFDLYRIRCNQFMNQVHQSHMTELIPITKTLQGDVTCILDSVRDLCPDNWLYGLSALLLFSNPTATKSDLGDIIAICIELQRSEIPYQDCIYQILSGDISCALVAIYSQVHISWLVAHLADLFHLSGHNVSNMIGKQSLRNRFVFEYGCQLMSDVNLWHLAPSYLLSCGNSGLQLVPSELLRHVYDEFTAEKAIDLCNRLQLNDVIVSICKQMSHRALARSCPESAVLWELRGNDHCAASNLIDHMVKQFIQCSGQVPYSSCILEELIAACKQPTSSLLSLCLAVQIMSYTDTEQRLTAAIKFLHRGDVHNHDLDIVIANEAARILQLDPDLCIHISVADIFMLMTLLYSNQAVSAHLNRALSNLILEPSRAITSQ